MPPSVLVPLRAAVGAFRDDPHPLLERRGELVSYGQGRYGFGPLLCGLMAAFDVAVQGIARSVGATSRQFPALIGADTLDRCKYLRSFPQSLTLVTHLREDLDAITRFARSVRLEGDALRGVDSTDLAPVRTLLASAVCFHWYAWLRAQTLGGDLAVTALGKCFRYESGNLGGIERLWDFTMREVIFVGAPEFVLARRKTTMDLAVELLDAWGLSFEVVSANDPFFVQDYSAQVAFQNAFGLKFEARATLPYKAESLAVGSFNYHQDLFGRMFDIQLAAGRPAHTSCVGFGLERLALAFVAQHGIDPERWPEQARRSVERVAQGGA
jgi:seryl-tRNA synthetase